LLKKDTPMFQNMSGAFRVFKADNKAVTAIEYALIAALIAVVIVVAVSALGTNVANTFNSVSSEL
jgi:pilus assembly protein Flp/PilA